MSVQCIDCVRYDCFADDIKRRRIVDESDCELDVGDWHCPSKNEARRRAYCASWALRMEMCILKQGESLLCPVYPIRHDVFLL